MHDPTDTHHMPNRQTVLIVDDAPTNIHILAQALQSDYSIKVAVNGGDALEIAHQHPAPDIILLDVMMPELDGFEVCRRLKADERTQPIPIIFVTAKNDDTDEQFGLSLGADDYITKPFSLAITKARIKNHLQRKQSLERLRENEARLDYSLHAGKLGAWTLNPESGEIWGSKLFGNLLGDANNFTDRRYEALLEYVYDEDRPEVYKRINNAVSNASSYEVECRIYRKDNVIRWLWIAGKLEHNQQSGQTLLYSVAQDITERKANQEALKIAAMVYNDSSEAMLVTDAQNRIVAVNPAFTRMTGYSPEEVIGKNPNILSSGHQDKAFYEAMWRELLNSGNWHGEIWNRRKDGSLYAEWLSINTIFTTKGAVHQRIALISDITEKKKSDELIWRQANFDSLTELPNRRLFRDRLEQAIKKAQRDKSSFLLLFIDLDHFKEVNDSLGHDTGDKLLIEAARRIQRCVRMVDTVARLGGDEFTVILTDFGDNRAVDRVINEILRRLSETFSFGENIGHVSASIGIAQFPNDASDAETLIKSADQAMYAAKERGRNRACYFTASMQQAAQQRQKLLNDLYAAIAEQQFEVYFQPIVNLTSGRIIKAEALLRWNHPSGKLVYPSEFITLAEETGLIIAIGDWVFRQALDFIARWRKKNSGLLPISVNMSPAQFQTGSDHRHWLELLKEMEIPGESVIIEITESLLINNNSNVEQQLLQLRSSGIQIAIDDFGTGYSALSCLKNFDVDYLKIDQSFIRELGLTPLDQALCEAIITMAGKLDITVIAEGIETVMQQSLLIDAGCEFGQGFLFSKAMTADAFETECTRLEAEFHGNLHPFAGYA